MYARAQAYFKLLISRLATVAIEPAKSTIDHLFYGVLSTASVHYIYFLQVIKLYTCTRHVSVHVYEL